MKKNFGYRYKALVGILIVLSLTLIITINNYSDLPEALVSQLDVGHSSEDATPLDDSPTSTLSSDRSEIGGDYSRLQEVDESKTGVSIDANNGVILVNAVEATLRDVLDVLVENMLVGVVDLRPDDQLAAQDTQFEKRTFNYSGSANDVLRFVMNQYNYSYAISHTASISEQLQTPATKLFLYGAVQGEGTIIPDKQQPSPTDAESVPVAEYPESQGRHATNLASGGGKERVNISDVLHNRALSAVYPTTASSSSGASQPGLSHEQSSVGSTPMPVTFDDETLRSNIADMTRRASGEVQALAAGLKEAEKSLDAQRNNAYGETPPQ